MNRPGYIEVNGVRVFRALCFFFHEKNYPGEAQLYIHMERGQKFEISCRLHVRWSMVIMK